MKKIKRLQKEYEISKKEMEEYIKQFFNVRNAEINKAGDVWIEGPCAGHWLDKEETRTVLKWIEESYTGW